MANTQKQKRGTSRAAEELIPRSWQFSLLWAAVIVGIGIIASATINPQFGRAVHWDWMAGVAPAGFIALTIAFRKRWV